MQRIDLGNNFYIEGDSIYFTGSTKVKVRDIDKYHRISYDGPFLLIGDILYRAFDDMYDRMLIDEKINHIEKVIYISYMVYAIIDLYNNLYIMDGINIDKKIVDVKNIIKYRGYNLLIVRNVPPYMVFFDIDENKIIETKINYDIRTITTTPNEKSFLVEDMFGCIKQYTDINDSGHDYGINKKYVRVISKYDVADLSFI